MLDVSKNVGKAVKNLTGSQSARDEMVAGISRLKVNLLACIARQSPKANLKVPFFPLAFLVILSTRGTCQGRILFLPY